MATQLPCQTEFACHSNLQFRLNELDLGEGVKWTLAQLEQLSREADEMFRRGETPDPELWS